MSTATLTRPDTAPTNAGHGGTIHWVCMTHDPERALCGRPVAGMPRDDSRMPSCVVCIDLDDQPCAVTCRNTGAAA